ncbi:hypothetical protein RHMOL_Rhmol05G0274300 [Rhododendron molle]|uniref:Uncharacterized protein n=1 Tax=Rhododendron molle TaxID=49168 RepID=A0ACC0NUV8_RHOML|nr:hypothetical protein RHMOL_Rhmol05G0274300 [Rhododendron molle]
MILLLWISGWRISYVSVWLRKPVKRWGIYFPDLLDYLEGEKQLCFQREETYPE